MKRLCVILGVLGLVSAVFADVQFRDVTKMIGSVPISASTVAWGDVNQDGRPDLFVGDAGASGSLLYLNTPSGFNPTGIMYNVGALKHVRTAQFVDYDSDGLLDIFCLTSDSRGAILYRQTYGHQFSPVNLRLSEHNLKQITSAVWTDMDGDGDLDLLLSNGPGMDNVIWLKQDGSIFTLVREGTFAPGEGAASSICVVDFNGDNTPDLYFGYSPSNDRAKLYRNDGGRYKECEAQCHLPLKCGMTGALWTDVNNDQFPDAIFPGNKGDQKLLLSMPANQKNRVFMDATNMPGFDEGISGSQTVQAADFDNDGFQDLFVVGSGNVAPTLMQNHSGTSWSTQSFHLENNGMHPPVVNACAIGDIDNDGYADIALAVEGQGVILLKNETSSVHEWIGLSLVGNYTATPLLDCQISMVYDNSKCIASTSTGTCAPGQSAPTVYLVNSTEMKSVGGLLTVNWPNGEHSTYNLKDVHKNAVNTLHEPRASQGTDLASVAKNHEAELDISNSPNPFNPTTTISFTVPYDMNVRLSVFDVLGREVTTLANAPYRAGTYNVTFNAANLPSGFYYARLNAGNETKLHRLLFLK